MSDALEYLRHLQSKVVSIEYQDIEDIIRYRKEQLKLSEHEVSEYIEKYRNINLLEYQESFYNEFIINPFINSLPEDVNSKLKNICVGMLPTYKVNASALKSPSGEPLIVLHNQLLTILQQYNEVQLISGKLMASKVASEQELGEKILKDTCKEIVKCFKYSTYMPRLKMLPATLSLEEYELSISKTFAQELFIILHEFAHIFLDHSYEVKQKTLYFSSSECSIEEYVRRQKLELEADLLATKWILEAYKNGKLSKNPIFRHINEAPHLILEVFMLFHLLDVNTSRYSHKLRSNADIPALRIIDMAKEADDLISRDTAIDSYSHPKASTRFIYVVAQTINEFSEDGKRFLSEMVWNMSFFETFKFDH